MPCADPGGAAAPARAPRRRRGARGLVVAGALLACLLLGAVAAAGVDAAVVPPAVTAEAGVLIDLATGEVLWAKNAEGDRAPASLVKLMTLYLAYEDLRSSKVRLSDRVTISENAVRTARYRMSLRAGQVVPFEILLAGVAVASANDAATAVAEHLGGSEEGFVSRMNAEGDAMGLAHTVFANPHGLPDPRQHTTARDMAMLAQHLLREFPESRDVLGQTQFHWGGRVYQRRIPLFRDPGGVTALKTGYTLEAGYNLAVAAGRAGHALLCIILGADTRVLSFLDAGRLLKFGFGEPPGNVRHKRLRARGPTSRSVAH